MFREVRLVVVSLHRVLDSHGGAVKMQLLVLPWTSEFCMSDVTPPNYLCFWKIHCQH